MKKELIELASLSIDAAKAAGAQACQADVNAGRQVEIGYRERKPETIKESATRQLTLRLYVNGRYSTQSTSDLRPAALMTFIKQAVDMTKLLAEDPFRTLPDPKYYAGRARIDLGLVDPAHAAFTPEARHGLIKAMEGACLQKGGARTISVEAGCSDGYSENVLLTSNGCEGYSDATYISLFASLAAQDEGDRRPSGYGYAVSSHRQRLPSPESLGIEAAERTLAMLGARKIKTETLPIIVENREVPRLLGTLVGVMNGQAIQQKQSFVADLKGKPVGSPLLTLVDDPHLVGGLGSRLFDGNGMATRKRTMIDAGILKDFYVGWYYSRKLGWEPNDGGTSNLILPPGRRTTAEIMRDLGRGILVQGFIGGNSNPTTGDASVGILGQLFDKGQIVHPVSEMNIAGNTVEFWKRLVEVANDPWPYGSWRMPSLVFKDVVVAGI